MNNIFGKESRYYWMGIAILAVIASHLFSFRQSDSMLFSLGRLLSLDGIGVNIFLMVSAYGLCHSYKKQSYWKYLRNRFVRLYPIYGVFLFLGVVFFFPEKDRTVMFALKQMTGISVFERNYTEWYVPALTVIYIFFPGLYKFVAYLKSKSHRLLFVGIALTVPLFYLSLNYITPSLMARLGGAIFIGIATYLYEKDGDTKSLRELFTLTAILTLVTFHDCAFCFYLPLLLYGLNDLYDKLPFKSFLSFLGRHSLCIFLAQNLFIQFKYANLSGNVWYDMLYCLLGVVILSVFFYYIQHFFWILLRYNKHWLFH